MWFLIYSLGISTGLLIGAILFIPRPVKKVDNRNLVQSLNIEV